MSTKCRRSPKGSQNSLPHRGVSCQHKTSVGESTGIFKQGHFLKISKDEQSCLQSLYKYTRKTPIDQGMPVMIPALDHAVLITQI